jgi:hypothetical protein
VRRGTRAEAASKAAQQPTRPALRSRRTRARVCVLCPAPSPAVSIDKFLSGHQFRTRSLFLAIPRIPLAFTVRCRKLLRRVHHATPTESFTGPAPLRLSTSDLSVFFARAVYCGHASTFDG